jgi:hypothetical protein
LCYEGIGFNRNIYLRWLDAAAAFCSDTDDLLEVRARLEPVVGQEIKSDVNRRKAIDILISIWGKSAALQLDPHGKPLSISRKRPPPRTASGCTMA